jgi:hypothetical protein
LYFRKEFEKLNADRSAKLKSEVDKETSDAVKLANGPMDTFVSKTAAVSEGTDDNCVVVIAAADNVEGARSGLITEEDDDKPVAAYERRVFDIQSL